VRRLGLIVLLLLAAAGCGSKRELTMRDILSRTRGPSEKELVRDMLVSPDPDVRRASIAELSSRKHGCEEPYLKGYAALVKDPDPLVRGEALRALGKGGDAKYAPEVIGALEDNHAKVRWDAAAALDAMPTKSAIPQLTYALLNDPSTDVRVASARALRRHRRVSVVETLLKAMDDVEFAVRFQSAESLREMTGEDMGTDPVKWRNALANRTDLFPGEPPKRRWWRRAPKEKPIEAPATQPATPKRPWWDWFRVTKPKRVPAG